MASVVIGFILCGVAVFTAGIILSRSADQIGELTSLGGVWAGLVLLGAATSIPELVTDVSAVKIHCPDLAAGDLFGSSLTNMLILGLLDLALARGRMLREASFGAAMAAILAIALNAAGATLVLLRPQSNFLGIVPWSALLLVIYLTGARLICRWENSAEPGASESKLPQARPRWALIWPIVEFGVGSILVFFAAPAFAGYAKQLARVTGFGDTFVGTWLLGFTTALPELVTSWAAVRIGAFDLAVSALFGSSAFNMVIFLPMDLAHQRGSIFASLDPALAVSGFLAVTLMAVGLASLTYRSERRFAVLQNGSGLLMTLYFLAICLVFACAK